MSIDAVNAAGERTLVLTQQMLAAAQRSAWEAVAALQGEREHALAEFFTRAAEAGADQACVAGIVTELRRLNECVQLRLDTARSECADLLKQVRQGRLAVDGYARMSGAHP